MPHSLPPPSVTSFIIPLVFPQFSYCSTFFPTLLSWHGLEDCPYSVISSSVEQLKSLHFSFHTYCQSVTNYSVEVLPPSFLANINSVLHSSLNYVSYSQLFTNSLNPKLSEQPPCIIPFVDRKGPYSMAHQQPFSHPSSWILL
jgi:hypothetical protein